MTPVFSWAPIFLDDPKAPTLFYRLEVADMDGKRIWASGRSEGMTACAVPEGRLQPGQTYQWRVRVTDSADWGAVQNRANSAWVNFIVAEDLHHSAKPAINLGNYGVATWSYIGGTGLEMSGLMSSTMMAWPTDGSSHHVTLTKTRQLPG